MRVSFGWLKDFVDIPAPGEEVAARLTMCGLEVEGMEKVDDDIIFEINVTPNRPDCLSVLGIAREVAAAFGSTLKIPDTGISGNLPASDVTVEIADPDLCNRYTGRLITGVKIGATPEWMKARLEKCGIRSLDNNIVDITNYVLLELGHPLHAFDADKLAGRRIRIARAGKKSTITTLDGTERNPPHDALLIWDGQKPVAMAGVMGGEESGVTLDSKNIFLESAYFEPTSIRRTSKETGLKTESSYRFERGTDIEFLVNALNRAALLVREAGGGTIHEIVDVYPVRYEPVEVEARYGRINTLLGTEIGKAEMRGLLERIGIRTEDRGDVFSAFPPSYRRDVTGYVDILEEVARLYNFGDIPVRVPRTVLADGILNVKELRMARIKESVRMSGFSEVVNYSFMNPADLDLLSLPEGDRRRRCLKVLNPLRQEDSLLRTTLVPSLINNFVYNLSRGVRAIRLFEFSRVFFDEGGKLPSEELRLGGLLYQGVLPSVWREEVPAFFVAKGLIEALLEELKIGGISYEPSKEIFLHRGKAADVVTKTGKIGYIGELSPEVAGRLGLKVQKPEIILCELDGDKLLSLVPAGATYSPVPRYPSVERDIAIIVDDDITAAQVMGYVKGYESELVEKAELFDYYKGKNIPGGRKSLAFRITYRSKNRTLTDNEIESVHKGLTDFVLLKTGGALRG